jgi:hypothetical protein
MEKGGETEDRVEQWNVVLMANLIQNDETSNQTYPGRCSCGPVG